MPLVYNVELKDDCGRLIGKNVKGVVVADFKYYIFIFMAILCAAKRNLSEKPVLRSRFESATCRK
jgi:hypothetical protein